MNHFVELMKTLTFYDSSGKQIYDLKNKLHEVETIKTNHDFSLEMLDIMNIIEYLFPNDRFKSEYGSSGYIFHKDHRNPSKANLGIPKLMNNLRQLNNCDVNNKKNYEDLLYEIDLLSDEYEKKYNSQIILSLYNYDNKQKKIVNVSDKAESKDDIHLVYTRNLTNQITDIFINLSKLFTYTDEYDPSIKIMYQSPWRLSIENNKFKSGFLLNADKCWFGDDKNILENLRKMGLVYYE